MDYKKYNVLIPKYVVNLNRDNKGFYLCPKCNHRLTYIENTDHIECEYCKDIHGAINLLMYSQHITFKDAMKIIKSDYESFLMSDGVNAVKSYSEIDKRTIGITYENNKYDPLKIYDTDYLEKPLIFCDTETGSLIFSLLLDSYLHSKREIKDIPNIISIKNVNYVYNAMSVLMRMKKSHHIKIFVITENDAESNKIKARLINDLNKYEFSNYRIPDLINHDLGRHKIIDEYKHNESFSYLVDNTLLNFNLLKKPVIERKTTTNDNLLKENEKTPKTGLKTLNNTIVGNREG